MITVLSSTKNAPAGDEPITSGSGLVPALRQGNAAPDSPAFAVKSAPVAPHQDERN